MWKLWNKLFGWDYVVILTVLDTYKVVRILNFHNNTATKSVLFGNEFVYENNIITWLTCKPEKYFN